MALQHQELWQDRDVTLEESLMCGCSPVAAGIKCEWLLVKLPGAGVALQECSGVASCGLLESSRNLPLLPCQIFTGNLYSSCEEHTAIFLLAYVKQAGIFRLSGVSSHRKDVTFFLRVSGLGDPSWNTSWPLADKS